MNLTDRAERALLGALLTDPARASAFTVQAIDFASELHGRVHHALRDGASAGMPPQMIGERATAEFGHAYLTELRDTCPDPRHVGAYARMVMEAALRRRLTEHADRMQTEAANFHYDMRRLEQASSAVPAEIMDFADVRGGDLALREVPGHQLKLSIALRGHLAFFDPARESREPERGLETDPRARPEEQILAFVIQQFEDARTVPGWLPPAAFTTGSRREMFDTIACLHARGEPIDELTADWERAKLAGADQPGEDHDTSYAARLARRPVDTRAALHSCHVLFRECVVASPVVNGHPGRPEPAATSAMSLIIAPVPPAPGTPGHTPRA